MNGGKDKRRLIKWLHIVHQVARRVHVLPNVGRMALKILAAIVQTALVAAVLVVHLVQVAVHQDVPPVVQVVVTLRGKVHVKDRAKDAQDVVIHVQHPLLVPVR